MFVLCYLIERTEDFLQFVGINADTVVLNGYGEVFYFRVLILVQSGRHEDSKFGE